MGHHITGLIARREKLGRLDGKFAGQPCFALAEGLAFMPLDHENLDEITGLHEGKAIGDFVYLTERLVDLLRLASRNGEIAYIETEYHGGTGGQGAVAFRDGEMIGSPDWREAGAINVALSKLGVAHRADRRDAFEAVGLGAFRSNDSFREMTDEETRSAVHGTRARE
jgi:hypothetical protein